jgi:hypothetical protein
MLIIAPMLPEHPKFLALQEAQEFAALWIAKDEYCDGLAKAGPAYSAIADGVVVGCGGVVTKHDSVGVAWALFSSMAGPHMMRITRETRRFFDALDYRRIETAVERSHGIGHRWANALGFQQEGIMRAYLPDGRDAVLYSIVRE